VRCNNKDLLSDTFELFRVKAPSIRY